MIDSFDLAGILGGSAAELREAAARCRRCGSCQQVCPVFASEERERASPRGRLQLLDAYLGRELRPSRDLADTISLCLGCGACTEHCPNNVRAGEILLAGKGVLRDLRPSRGQPIRAALGRPGLLRKAAAAGRLLRPLWARRVPADRGLHLRWTAGKAMQGRRLPPLAQAFLGKLWKREDLSPGLPLPEGEGEPCTSAGVTAEAPGPEKVVGLFPGCVSTYLTPDAALGAARILRGRGFAVELPDGLGCCGLAMLAAGDRRAAVRAVQRNLDALDPQRYDRIVTPCASCAAMLKQYMPALARELDAASAERAEQIAGKVQVLSQALLPGSRSGDPPSTAATPKPGTRNQEPATVSRAASARLTYHLPCHLAHALGDRESGPRALSELAGAQYVEAEGFDECCGHGGLFSLNHPEVSSRIGARKAERLLATGARAVVTECSGCLLQLYDLVGREDPSVEVLWLAEAVERWG